jgi:type IV secretory pathway protease TraF
MKLDLNFQLKNLDGTLIEDGNAGKIIAQALANDTQGDALKWWEWAVKLNKGEVLTLDTSDKEKLIKFVQDHQGLPNITKAQVLSVLKK